MDEIMLVPKDELMHYGVKGMRWGHRKKPDAATGYLRTNQALSGVRAIESLRKGNIAGAAYYAHKSRYYGKAANERSASNSERPTKQPTKPKERPTAKRTQSDDHIRAKELKKKKLSELSNAELKELNNRMNLESQYKNLKKQNMSVGRKFVQDVARETAKNTASEYARKYTKKGINYVINMRSGS